MEKHKNLIEIKDFSGLEKSEIYIFIQLKEKEAKMIFDEKND
jgi:hypothetical protein